MSYKVLLLGNERKNGLKLARLLIDLGHEPLVDDWVEFNPRSYTRFSRPKLIIANCDHPGMPAFDEFCFRVRKVWGCEFPIVALAQSRKFGRVAELVDAGANACLAPDEGEQMISRKISACLLGNSAPAVSELTEEVPGTLLGLFLGNHDLVRLGDLAAVYSGAAPRSGWSRRTAPPDDSWRKVITADMMDRFHIGAPSTYLLWSKLHLFRVPALEEYSVPEKVVVSRVGPPLTAAVDRARLAVGADMYSIVPGEGVGAGYLACLLNSRLLDFYFNRLAGPQDGRLRPEGIRNVPVPRPGKGMNREFERYATLLSHFGPSPENWIDRQSRDEVRECMDEAVFAAYGVGAAAREELAGLHF